MRFQIELNEKNTAVEKQAKTVDNSAKKGDKQPNPADKCVEKHPGPAHNLAESVDKMPKTVDKWKELWKKSSKKGLKRK